MYISFTSPQNEAVRFSFLLVRQQIEDILPGKCAVWQPSAGGRATGVRVGRRTAPIENNKGREMKRRAGAAAPSACERVGRRII